MEYRTLGTCQVKFRDVIHTSGERIHYNMPLIGESLLVIVSLCDDD